MDPGITEKCTSSLHSRRGALSARLDGLRCHWSSVFYGLTTDQISSVQALCRTVRHTRRECLFHEGAHASDVAVVKSGRIKCYMSGLEGEMYTCAIYGRGRVTGLVSGLLQMPRMVTAETLVSSEIDYVSAAGLRAAMSAIPQFGINIACLVAAMTADLIWVLDQRTLAPAMSRLCSALLLLGNTHIGALVEGEATASTISGLSQEELANFVGVTRTWMNQMLANLERSNVIVRDKKKIVLSNTKLLEQIAGRQYTYPLNRF